MKNLLPALLALLCTNALDVHAAALAAPTPTQPNVLFIAVDDLNDYIGPLARHPGVKTPNFDRLAKRSVTFASAAPNRGVPADSKYNLRPVLRNPTTERAGALESTKIHLNVDFALPTSETNSTPLPGTLKSGWTPFVAARWRDMYMHDGVWEDGSTGDRNPPKTKGLSGSGVHVAVDCAREGNGGFAVFGMERDNLGGGGEPKGEPQGEPIANGWFHNVDWGGENRGDIVLRINGLPAGEYEMTCYHNHWEPQKQKTRKRLDQPSKMPPMTRVRAMPLSLEKGGTGRGVTSIKEAKNIKVTSETSDDKVATSVIRFKTDGSNDVVVIIDGGDDTYPDPARKGREGSKGILNAFKIDQLD